MNGTMLTLLCAVAIYGLAALALPQAKAHREVADPLAELAAGDPAEPAPGRDPDNAPAG